MNQIPFKFWKAVVFPIISRFLMGEDVILSDKNLKKIKEELEKFSDISRDIDIQNPLTWPRALSSLIEKKLENAGVRKYESVNEYSQEEYGLDVEFIASTDNTAISPIIEEITENGLKYYPDKVKEIKLKEDSSQKFTEIASGLFSTNSHSRTYFMCSMGCELREYLEVNQTLFWEDSSCKLFDSGGSGRSSTSISNMNIGSQKYYGYLSSKKDKIRRMFDKKGKWTLLLQGKPGVGKTTYCYEIANQLSDRVLVISANYFSNMSYSNWQFIEEHVAPEVVVFNDIDRLDFLENKLSILEERTLGSVELILMTTNNVSSMDEAVKRPGRVDHIIEMEVPCREVRDYVLNKFAEDIGLGEIPEEHREKLDKVQVEGSPAHIKEILNRAKYWGWDDEDLWEIHNLSEDGSPKGDIDGKKDIQEIPDEGSSDLSKIKTIMSN